MPARVRTIPATINRFTSMAVNVPARRRVAGYARVSTDLEEQQNSYDAQVRYYTEYIRSNPGWEFVGMYTEM